MLKCWNCGSAEVLSGEQGERNAKMCGKYFHHDCGVRRHYCKGCAEKVTRQNKEDLQEYARLKKKVMFERALKILEGQPLNIYDYQEAIQAVGEYVIEKPDKFDSAYEMIAAIILIDNEIECELQYRVGRFQCDFRLPSMKVILEIDGERHKNKAGSDSVRDEKILKELGVGWEIIRIKTDYLDQKAELLVEAIKTILKRRRQEKMNRKALREQYK